jgi:hypothetical protein
MWRAAQQHDPKNGNCRCESFPMKAKAMHDALM